MLRWATPTATFLDFDKSIAKHYFYQKFGVYYSAERYISQRVATTA